MFVIASSYLLFPLTRPTGEFFRRRAVRILIPFFIWAAIYTWHFGGKWVELGFNFPSAGGFYFRIPGNGVYPVHKPYAAAVELEMSIEYCGLGVCASVLSFFLVIRKIPVVGKLVVG